MFSSYPTTTVLPTRRAQTPPISSLPTSPSDEVGRRQSLTSPDSQTARPTNRTGILVGKNSVVGIDKSCIIHISSAQAFKASLTNLFLKAAECVYRWS